MSDETNQMIEPPVDPTLEDYQVADLLEDEDRLFLIWAIGTRFCTTLTEFRTHFDDEQYSAAQEFLNQLVLDGFVQWDGDVLVLTHVGQETLDLLTADMVADEIPSEFARFATAATIAERFTGTTLSEEDAVEQPFIDALIKLGWTHIEGDRGVPTSTERQGFSEVLLKDRLRRAIHTLNPSQPLDDAQLARAISELEHPSGSSLMEANKSSFDLLYYGALMNDVAQPDKQTRIHFIDWEHPERNDYVVINQFRVDSADRREVIPDIVLFINGIPVGVVECKSPATANPVREAIAQLRRYSRQDGQNDAIPQLFVYNQVLVATCYYTARVGTLGAGYEHFQEWKDTAPVSRETVKQELGKEELSSQDILIAGMLRPAHLIDLIAHYMLFDTRQARITKIMAHYHQYRAVRAAIKRLSDGQQRNEATRRDQRGGIVWHTQGSGKSYTMVFLVRVLRAAAAEKLHRLKVVVISDRIDLHEQLSETLVLTGQPIIEADTVAQLLPALRDTTPTVVTTKMQLFQEFDKDLRSSPKHDYPELNTSSNILVLIDEAHRSQASDLHTNLESALPNAAMIGFTGTPILWDDQKKTHDIFGPYIDTYTIYQSEQDGATVPIYYEGHRIRGILPVEQEVELDSSFTHMFRDRSPGEQNEIQQRYAQLHLLLEARPLIEAKARDMLRHYITTIMPNGFKAMITAATRVAALRYRDALMLARDELLASVADFDPAIVQQFLRDPLSLDVEQRVLAQVKHAETQIRALEFATVITVESNDEPELQALRRTSGELRALLQRFKRPLGTDHLAFLTVRDMLLTGFDAPPVQVLYVDRFMRRHTLLQAVARVNRTYRTKQAGMVVDYIGLAQFMREALDAYTTSEVRGALADLRDEVMRLSDRHQRVLAIFRNHHIFSLEGADADACIRLLEQAEIRADFILKYRKFLDSLEIIMPRREAQPYLHDARLLKKIDQAAMQVYQDDQLGTSDMGNKVRELLDTYLRAEGMEITQAPISITDPHFEDTIARYSSDETKASAMEHALEAYIELHKPEDPIFFESLSARLRKLLAELEEQWQALVVALLQLLKVARQGRGQDDTGLDPSTQAPFYAVLAHENGGIDAVTAELRQRLIAATIDIVDLIRAEIQKRDFWLKAQRPAQEELSKTIYRYLDDNVLIPHNHLEEVVDTIMQIARRRYLELLADGNHHS